MDKIPTPNIPAALNDPSSNKKSDIFSKRYGEYFENATPSITLDVIHKEDFSSYLNLLKKIAKHKKKLTLISTKSVSNSQEKNLLKEDSEIPPYYFSQDFSFRNPAIYKNLLPPPTHKVSEWLGPANIIHEKLSHFLDEIETSIALSVSQKSDGFIHALTYVGNLGDYLQNTCLTIGEIRKTILKYLQTCAQKTLIIHKKYLKLSNLYKICDKLKIMAIICQTQPTLQILLSNNEYLGAFDLVSSSRDVLSKELNGVKSFRFLDAQLLEIENLIFRMLWSEYTSILSKHFEPCPFSRPENFEGVPSSQPIHSDLWAQLLTTDTAGSLFADLSSVVMGMLYLRNLSFIEFLKEESCTFIDTAIVNKLKMGIESYFLSHNRQLEEISLIDALPKLDLASFASLMEAIFNQLSAHLKKIQLFAILISVLLYSASPQNNPLEADPPPPQVEPSWALLATSLVKTTSYLNAHDVSHVITEDEKEKALTKLRACLVDIVAYTRDETAKLLDNWARHYFQSSTLNPGTGQPGNSEHSNGYASSNEISSLRDSGRALTTSFNPWVRLYTSAHNYYTSACYLTAPAFLASFTPKNNVNSTPSHPNVTVPARSELHLPHGPAADTIYKNEEGDIQGNHDLANGHSSTAETYPPDKNPFSESDEETSSKIVSHNPKPRPTPSSSISKEAKDGLRDDYLATLRKLILQSLNAYGQRLKRDLDLTLAKDKWKPVDVTPAFQDRFAEFCHAGVSSLRLSDLEIHVPPEKNALTPRLTMNKQSYVMCNSSLQLLKSILILIRLSQDFPFSAKFIASVLCHLLKVFNSRTCHLLLGAGAIESAGLKSITTRHLALSLRNLKFFRDFMPTLATQWSCAHIEKHKGLEKNLLNTANDFTKHMEEIMAKMVEIMNANLSHLLDEWEIKAPTPSPVFLAITKQLELFHATINAILSPETAQNIMSRVDIAFRNSLRERIYRFSIPNDGGPRSGVVISELAFYRTSLNKLNPNQLAEPNDQLFWNSIWPTSTA